MVRSPLGATLRNLARDPSALPFHDTHSPGSARRVVDRMIFNVASSAAGLPMRAHILWSIRARTLAIVGCGRDRDALARVARESVGEPKGGIR
jgi:hypothetical protein